MYLQYLTEINVSRRSGYLSWLERGIFSINQPSLCPVRECATINHVLWPGQVLANHSQGWSTRTNQIARKDKHYKVFFVHLQNRLRQNFLEEAGWRRKKIKDDVFITKECEYKGTTGVMLLEETNDRLMMKDRLPRQATQGPGPGPLISNEERWSWRLTNDTPGIITQTLNNRWDILLRVLLADSESIY